MKKIFVKDIKEKDRVTGSFLVTKKESGMSKSGKAYLILRLMDRTGELEARVWENADELCKNFEKDDVVDVSGFAVAYQNSVQVNVNSIKAIAEGGYALSDFLPASERDPDEMLREIDAIVSSMRDEHIKGLLTDIFSDPDVRARYRIAPAAKSMHHPYLSGLIEHALSICGLVEKVTEHYGPSINKDLLLAGALLHDIGKIYELSYSRSFEYTDEGRLLGHITMGIELVDEKLRERKGFPRELALRLKHMLLSHHGHLEFGSPKRPKTIEAIILYYLDDMDAKVNTVRALVTGHTEGEPAWTPYQRIFERFIYKGRTPSNDGEAEEAASEDTPEKAPAKTEDRPEEDVSGNDGDTLTLFR